MTRKQNLILDALITLADHGYDAYELFNHFDEYYDSRSFMNRAMESLTFVDVLDSDILTFASDYELDLSSCID